MGGGCNFLVLVFNKRSQMLSTNKLLCGCCLFVPLARACGVSLVQVPFMKRHEQALFPKLVVRLWPWTEAAHTHVFSYTHAFSFFRWRTSFLLSLIFGLPALVVMIYFMFGYKGEEKEEVASNTTTIRPRDLDHKPQLMLTKGLSLENLLMFLLSTPVQVGT